MTSPLETLSGEHRTGDTFMGRGEGGESPVGSRRIEYFVHFFAEKVSPGSGRASVLQFGL